MPCSCFSGRGAQARGLTQGPAFFSKSRNARSRNYGAVRTAKATRGRTIPAKSIAFGMNLVVVVVVIVHQHDCCPSSADTEKQEDISRRTAGVPGFSGSEG